MQWNCPHCGIILAVPFNTLGTGWSFSRCYKCGGFALIRRAEVNIIKVDKAPPGEKVILPEAGTDPASGLLNEEAAQNLAKHTKKQKTTTPPPLPALSNPPESSNGHLLFETLPSPETVLERQKQLKIHKSPPSTGVILATFFAIGSGIYLFIQGQNTYQKVKEITSEKAIESANKKAKNEVAPPPLAENKVTVEPKPIHPLITDQVQESAMAPIKPSLAPEPAPAPAIHALMQVRPRLKRVSLHEGPGMQFPVIGIASLDTQYVVSDWKDRWFKIAMNSNGSLNEVGWIRNDLIQVLP